jgi:hypothetical protein
MLDHCAYWFLLYYSFVRTSTFCVCVRMVPNESDTKEGCARIWGSRSCSVFLQRLVSNELVGWAQLTGLAFVELL